MTRSPRRNRSSDGRSRSGFTLLELLVMIAIITILAGVSVLSLASGKDAARMKGVTRDVFAIIRYARSSALVSRQPSIITYSTVKDGEETMARIEVLTANETAKLEDLGPVQTLSGEPLRVEFEESGGLGAWASSNVTVVAESDSGSEPFTPLSQEVATGMRLKVVSGDGELEADPAEAAKRKTKISVFSNVDYLLGKYSDYKKKEAEKKESEAASFDSAPSVSDELQEPVSFVWESNGRVEPHRVYIYPDGSTPESGLSIKVDRFGAARVIAPGDEDW